MPFLTYDPFPQCLQQSPLTPLLLARVTSEEVGAIYQTLSVSYFRLSAAGAAGFGLANALATGAGGGASFFLSALGFLASRLVLFWPFAITILPSGCCRELPIVGSPPARRHSEPLSERRELGPAGQGMTDRDRPRSGRGRS